MFKWGRKMKNNFVFSQLLQKSVITPDFEKNYSVPPYSESKHQIQKQRRVSRTRCLDCSCVLCLSVSRMCNAVIMQLSSGYVFIYYRQDQSSQILRAIKCGSINVFSVTFHIFVHKYSFWFRLFWCLGVKSWGLVHEVNMCLATELCLPPPHTAFDNTPQTVTVSTGSPSTSFRFYTCH